NGFSTTSSDVDLATSQYYQKYLNQHVFTPSGVGAVAVKPHLVYPTLWYPNPAGSGHRTTFGHETRDLGGSGWHLSSNDLVSIMTALRESTALLSSDQVDTMFGNGLGWDQFRNNSFGRMYYHGGYLFTNTANGRAEVNAYVGTGAA